MKLGGTPLVWWERKTQEDLLIKGKIISSWYEFISALKKLLYSLGYKQKAMMEWKNYRQGEEKSVQYYTQEFGKRDIMLGIPLYTQEKFLNIYVGYMVI